MKNHSSESTNNSNWKEVLVDIIVKIITLGLYHVERHRSKDGAPDGR